MHYLGRTSIRIPEFTSAAWRAKKVGKLAYYSAGIFRDLIPEFLLTARLKPFYERIEAEGVPESIARRVAYYNKLAGPFDLGEAPRVGSMPLDRTFYYYDFRRISKYFGDGIRAYWEFGDVIHVPDKPAVIKSRPLDVDNVNSVVMKLESFRHYQWSQDEIAFADKAPRAVWRGILNNPRRENLVRRFGDSRVHDIGHADRETSLPGLKPFISVADQLTYKYVLSIEGNDVATNLKWIMSSNSLCMMPRPRYETWYMEGALQPGVHYVGLNDDFSDLEDKIAYYESNPDEAQAIIASANAYTQQFRDPDSELTASLLVLQKYLELGGQIPPRYFADGCTLPQAPGA